MHCIKPSYKLCLFSLQHPDHSALIESTWLIHKLGVDSMNGFASTNVVNPECFQDKLLSLMEVTYNKNVQYGSTTVETSHFS